MCNVRVGARRPKDKHGGRPGGEVWKGGVTKDTAGENKDGLRFTRGGGVILELETVFGAFCVI